MASAAAPLSALLPLLPLLLCLFCSLGVHTSVAQPLKLVQEEVEALGKINAKLKIGWDFSVDPCSAQRGWLGSADRNVTCDCNNVTDGCHVTIIQLKSQNLTGVLPEELGNLTKLKWLDLTRNYINGTIPAAAWASLPLTHISLLGNRISGRIPRQIGNISTLESLVLEQNSLRSPLPRALGRLRNLTRLIISSNDFSGDLPDSLANLNKLTEFRIDGTGISGGIPTFIRNWANLSSLYMQGTSMEGPFPPIFSNLRSLRKLRVTDMKSDGKFPNLQGLDLQYLDLRNCSISGPIPDYIWSMSNLKSLDLSFNNLTGELPGNIKLDKGQFQYMFLTSNMLSGAIPDWILQSSKRKIDVSYNNFTGSPHRICQEQNINLVASYSFSVKNSINPCITCPAKPKNYNLFINCGGPRVTVGRHEYEEDTSKKGESSFVLSSSANWAFSSTGYFFDNESTGYIAETSKLNMTNPELYLSARLSPSSLKYYGLCLQKGNYTVTLHFAEIMFTNDATFSSIGRRLFDVAIQGRKVLRNFNIVAAANGTGREVFKNFSAYVEDTILEIHFQWAGKGTNSVPFKGAYGPLISAISVTPDFPPDFGEKRSLSVGAILGIVVASCAVILLMLLFLWFCIRKKHQVNNELRRKLQTAYFSLSQIKTATGNFNPANKIGEGGFGPVYKGLRPDGSLIAVKQLSSKSRQGNREFVNEIGMISALQHPNLVKLFGCCIEGNQLLLVYEYMENNSLASALFGSEEMALKLDWQRRSKICLDIARGLAYLHEESRLKIVHRDIKATNILLDKDLNAKISDFGLAKLDDEEKSHITTRIAGTKGYMAPEYAMRGHLTDKADVYSFGVVMLEIVSGKANTNYRPEEKFTHLLDQAYVLQEQGALLDLVDPRLDTNYSKEEAERILNLALLCTNASPAHRPAMSVVVSMLEGGVPVDLPTGKHLHSKSNDMSQKPPQESQEEGIASDGPWITSSTTISSTKEESTPSLHSQSVSERT